MACNSRDDQLRGELLDAGFEIGPQTIGKVTELMRDGRAFVFVPCAVCPEMFIMTFNPNHLFFLPFMVSEALALHLKENHHII